MREHEGKFREYLKSNNLKSTPERMTVLKEVLSADGHFDVDQLFERIKKYDKRASRATVYRVLPLLVDAGFVAETLRCQGRVSYERVYELKEQISSEINLPSSIIISKEQIQSLEGLTEASSG